MTSKFIFKMDINSGSNSKDKNLINQNFILRGEGENGEDLKGKLIDITREGSYIFKILNKDSELDEIICQRPNEKMEIIK